MKLTESKLRRIIREEARKLNEAKTKFGAFVYDRNTDENEVADDNYKSAKDAVRAAKKMIRNYPKKEYYIEAWESDEKGRFGNTGEALWSNF